MRVKKDGVDTPLNRYDLYLHDDYDADIIAYLESVPSRRRAAVIREMVRRGMGLAPSTPLPASTAKHPSKKKLRPAPMPDADVDWQNDFQDFGFPTTDEE